MERDDLQLTATFAVAASADAVGVAEDLVLDLLDSSIRCCVFATLSVVARLPIAYFLGGRGSSGRRPGIGGDWSGLVARLVIVVSSVEVVRAGRASGP